MLGRYDIPIYSNQYISTMWISCNVQEGRDSNVHAFANRTNPSPFVESPPKWERIQLQIQELLQMDIFQTISTSHLLYIQGCYHSRLQPGWCPKKHTSHQVNIWCYFATRHLLTSCSMPKPIAHLLVIYSMQYGKMIIPGSFAHHQTQTQVKNLIQTINMSGQGAIDQTCIPQKLTWQWNIHHFKMYFLLKMGIFQCHVSFQGCKMFNRKGSNVLSKTWSISPTWPTTETT